MNERTASKKGARVKQTWIMPTARAEFLDPGAPLARPPVAPARPWIPNLELPAIFPVYREERDV